MDSMIVPCCGDLRELRSGHYHKTVEITENAGKCLQEEYMVRSSLSICNFFFLQLLFPGFKCSLDVSLFQIQVDEPSCSTPKRRSFNLPSMASIEELRTPAFEDLLKSFWDSKSGKYANGDVKHLSGLIYEAHQAQSLRDSRLPLTTIN